MKVVEFAERFAEALDAAVIPQDLESESDFECDFVLPTAMETVSAFANVHLFAHRFGGASSCTPNCVEASEGRGIRVVGCSKCWTASKPWATVSAFGMRHTFDLMARDDQGRTLAVEIKWIGFRGGRAPNSEFQRFLGQCALAASRHDSVLGVCGTRGGKDKFRDQEEEVQRTFRQLGVRLLLLKASDQLDKIESTSTW